MLLFEKYLNLRKVQHSASKVVATPYAWRSIFLWLMLFIKMPEIISIRILSLLPLVLLLLLRFVVLLYFEVCVVFFWLKFSFVVESRFANTHAHTHGLYVNICFGISGWSFCCQRTLRQAKSAHACSNTVTQTHISEENSLKAHSL